VKIRTGIMVFILQVFVVASKQRLGGKPKEGHKKSCGGRAGLSLFRLVEMKVSFDLFYDDRFGGTIATLSTALR